MILMGLHICYRGLGEATEESAHLVVLLSNLWWRKQLLHCISWPSLRAFHYKTMHLMKLQSRDQFGSRMQLLGVRPLLESNV